MIDNYTEKITVSNPDLASPLSKHKNWLNV